MISSLGLNADESWNNMVQGKSGVRRITLFNPSQLQTQIAAQATESFQIHSKEQIKKRQARQMTRVTQMCYVCAKDLISKEKINFEDFDKTRCAVILGVVNTGNSSLERVANTKNRIIKGYEQCNVSMDFDGVQITWS